MITQWTSLFNLFLNALHDFLYALDNLLNSSIGINKSMKDINFNLYLFSDNSIIEFNLYDLIYFILLFLVLRWFFKFILMLFNIPLRFIRRGGL